MAHWLYGFFTGLTTFFGWLSLTNRDETIDGMTSLIVMSFEHCPLAIMVLELMPISCLLELDYLAIVHIN